MISNGDIFKAAMYVAVGVCIGASPFDTVGEMMILGGAAFLFVLGLLSLVYFVMLFLCKLYRWASDGLARND